MFELNNFITKNEFLRLNHMSPDTFNNKIEKNSKEGLFIDIKYWEIIEKDGSVIHCITQIYNFYLGCEKEVDDINLRQLYEENEYFYKYLYYLNKLFFVNPEDNSYEIFLDDPKNDKQLIIEFFKDTKEKDSLIKTIIDTNGYYTMISFQNKMKDIKEVEI